MVHGVHPTQMFADLSRPQGIGGPTIDSRVSNIGRSLFSIEMPFWPKWRLSRLTRSSRRSYSQWMRKSIAQLEAEAGRLSVKERAKLIRRLIATLESEDEGDIERSWLDEAEKRLAAYRNGETRSRPGEDIFDEIVGQT